MKRFSACLILIISLFIFSFSVYAVDLPEPTNDFFVNDFADVISAEDEAEMLKIGADLYSQTTAQVVVVTVDSLDGCYVNEYALELGREWGVGSEETNNGVVLLLSVSDREVTIQVGYGLEGCLTDAGTGKILDDYAIPYLSNDDFSTGLLEAYRAIAGDVCTEYGVELNPDYQITYDDYDSTENDREGMTHVIFYVLFTVLILLILVVGRLSQGGNSGGNSNNRGGGYYGGTRYGGTVYHGGSSGGFSGGGGFRGGGGSFGGGGSSRGF